MTSLRGGAPAPPGPGAMATAGHVATRVTARSLGNGDLTLELNLPAWALLPAGSTLPPVPAAAAVPSRDASSRTSKPRPWTR